MQKASHTLPSDGTVIPTAVRHAAASTCQHGTQAKVQASPRTFLQCTVQLPVCVFVLEERRRRVAEEGTSTQQEAQLDGSDTCGTAPASTITHGGSTHPSTKKENYQENGGRVWLCVCGAADVCPPWPQKKQNKSERNVCSAPQALVARPHVTAPSARGASRPLLMRAAGEAHRAVVMSVSVGVRVEQLGGKHAAPLTGRVQQETIDKKSEE
ncbi:hypothetical protein MOQ_002351 [Trypanosoma cruzi marinkellei]|uniref:Uncharacterized protein n=1 Tax=Trypanosoma cruzi marinkellei TaxID=85056 RepID=K2P215_TRYCR|nr:hypothetical protein MOQ_002351 [Trypanosoma cruzi marinkellei]